MPAVTSAGASRRTPSDDGAVASSARSASTATARRQRIWQAVPLRISSYRGHTTDLVCTRRVVILSLSSGPGLFSGMRRPTASVVRVGVHCGIPIAWDLDSWLGKDDPFVVAKVVSMGRVRLVSDRCAIAKNREGKSAPLSGAGKIMVQALQGLCKCFT